MSRSAPSSGRDRGKAGGRTGKAGGSRRIELQFHPADIRKRVRYLFLERRQLVPLVIALVLYLGFLGLSLAVAPEVVGSLLSRREHATLLEERAELQGRMEVLVERLGRVEERGQDLRLQLSKIFLAYGLSTDESIGQGGYPFEPPPLPAGSPAGKVVEAGNRLRSRLHEQDRMLAAFLAEVQEFEGAHREQVRTTPSRSPLRGTEFVLTSPYGNRLNPFTQQRDFHAGIDLAADRGVPVYAPGDGYVSFAGRYPLRRSVGWWRYGNLVVLRHGDRFVSLYGHLDEVKARRGQQVSRGDVLGTVGDSGWSTSPHLHYEVRRRIDGELRPVDPRIYILDHRWGDEERLLVRVRSAPGLQDFEPLPPLLAR